jgi:AAA15 family ATPase/GTPase
MLKSIKITNFCSIGATQKLLFIIPSEDILDSSAVSIADQNINLVSCIIGANASGKTTALKALTFLFWLINDSYTRQKSDENIPVDAHKLHEKDLTKIEIEFLNEGKTFKYRIELDKEKIQHEFLSEISSEPKSTIFQYTRQNGDWDFATSFEINANDLDRFKERKNVSVLSSLIATGYLPDMAFIKSSKTNVTAIGVYRPSAEQQLYNISKLLASNEDMQNESLKFLKDVDIGISNFELKYFQPIGGGEPIPLLQCIHQTENGNFTLPLFMESNGTTQSLTHLIEIIPILKAGGIVILDEIEMGIHPLVVKKIIYLFENPEINTRNAQLIFSTHQAFLLNDRTKTQIFIAEKDSKKAETEIFRLDNVEGVEDYENHFHRYLAGAYGGIPNIKWL